MNTRSLWSKIQIQWKKTKCISKFIKNVYKVDVQLFTKSRMLKLRFIKSSEKVIYIKYWTLWSIHSTRAVCLMFYPIMPAYLEWQVLIFWQFVLIYHPLLLRYQQKPDTLLNNYPATTSSIPSRQPATTSNVPSSHPATTASVSPNTAASPKPTSQKH